MNIISFTNLKLDLLKIYFYLSHIFLDRMFLCFVLNLFWISHLDDYKARSIHRIFESVCQWMCVCCYLNMPWYKHTGVLKKRTMKKKWYDNHEFSKDNVWREEVVVAAARRPNMSLKYFHFAQFYGFKKWKNTSCTLSMHVH